MRLIFAKFKSLGFYLNQKIQLFSSQTEVSFPVFQPFFLAPFSLYFINTLQRRLRFFSMLYQVFMVSMFELYWRVSGPFITWTVVALYFFILIAINYESNLYQGSISSTDSLESTCFLSLVKYSWLESSNTLFL